MPLYTTELKPFFEHNLIEELFVVKGKCTICTLAGWKLVAVVTDPNVIEKIGGYTGLIVDQKYIESSFLEETKENLRVKNGRTIVRKFVLIKKRWKK